jgi:hypothetical protein
MQMLFEALGMVRRPAQGRPIPPTSTPRNSRLGRYVGTLECESRNDDHIHDIQIPIQSSCSGRAIAAELPEDPIRIRETLS